MYAITFALCFIATQLSEAPTRPVRGPVNVLESVESAPSSSPLERKRILVRFRPEVPEAERETVRRTEPIRKKVRAFRSVPGLELLEVDPERRDEALAALRADARVMYAEPDRMVRHCVQPNDPQFGQLWGLHNTGQFINGDPGVSGADIGALAAWNLWTGDPSFRVAVIDTGVDYSHPDLAANIWTNPGEIAGNGLDDDNNGYVDDVHGYDFFNFDSDPMDDHGHGTHVAGTIGAMGNNGMGIVGVNWQVKIVCLKFLGAEGGGLISGAVEALQYAYDNGIRLSNNSWGAEGYSDALYDIIAVGRDADHLLVAAAGNDTADVDQSSFIPAGYDLDNILSVAAINNNDLLATFSNFGLTSVDLGAPGVQVLSTIPNSLYTYFSGTSMASPHVAGVAALFLSHVPTVPYSQARYHLLNTTRPVAALAGETVTGGVVNAAAAIGDCNRNGISDDQDIASGTSLDCGANTIPDECEFDCNNNGIADSCELFLGVAVDCTGNGILDDCESDCNANGLADSCDLAAQTSDDCNHNQILDDCEPDCNNNNIADACDINAGASDDCTQNGVPDECEADCDNDGVANVCEIYSGSADDCNGNLIPDSCDLSSGTSVDCTNNGTPDDCEYDCNENDVADTCEIAAGTLADSNGDGVADVCQSGMRLVPISASGPHSITGNEIFLPSGGQRLTFEVRLSGWNPEQDGTPQLRFYQATLDHAGFTSGQAGTVEYARISCTTNGQCRPGFYGSPGLCIGGFCDIPSAVYIDMQRSDYVFAGLSSVGGVFLNSGFPPFVGASLTTGAVAPADPGAPKYGATILLDVSPDAEGTFVIGFDPGPSPNEFTFWGQSVTMLIPIPSLVAATIRLPADCNHNGTPDDQDINSGASDCNGNGIPDACITREIDCNINVRPDACDIASGLSIDFNQNGVPDECEPPVLFVNANAVGDNTGRSWENAFTDLQDALERATESGGLVDEIWVARGTYRPSKLLSLSDPRSYSFKLVDGVSLYGGFVGGETNREDRDVQLNETILSGDVSDNDGPNFTNTGENALHVVEGSGAGASAVLDGFTITAGNAEGNWWTRQSWGGGLLIRYGSPTIINCTFRGNRASDGGGIACEVGSPTIANCLFLDNQAETWGGGVHYQGAGLAEFHHCRFLGNRSDYGAGLYTQGTGCRTNLYNSLFSGNTAVYYGGVYLTGDVNNVVNCTVVGNQATGIHTGAGMRVQGIALVANSIFYDNWGGTQQEETTQIQAFMSPTIKNCCIENWSGTLGGVGNFGDDPLFLNPLGTDGVVGTLDDDLRLAGISPAADAGDVTLLPPTLTTDLVGNPRVVASSVDVGAYEQVDCNGNNIPDSNELDQGALDCDADGRLDECEPDCDSNGTADDCDPDVDGDGAIDACDACPTDPLKTALGVCGCGTPDTDSDGDSVANCVDNCILSNANQADCQSNGIGDICDIASAFSHDCNVNAIPDECEMCTGAMDCCESDACTCNQCQAGNCVFTPIKYGNVNCDVNDLIDLDDILCVLRGFGGFSLCPNADIAPACTGNRIISLDDILSVLAAFAGVDPCNCVP